MIQVPAFRSNLQATFLHRDRALLSSAQQQIMIEGELCGRVAARIDGCSTALEIVNSMGAEADPLEVLHALVQMEEKGLLMEAESDLSAEEAAFWRRLEIAPRDAAARLRQSQVDVITLGDAANIEQELAASLEKSGLTRHSEAPFAMVITDNFLDSRLRDLNREFRLRKTSWMLLKPTGVARIGPLFHPETACWECLAARFHESPATSDSASLAPTRAWIANLATAEAAKWIVLQKSSLENTVVTADPFALQVAHHPVIRRPQCPECGDGFRLDPSRIALDASAGETHLHAHLDPLTGIVPFLKTRAATHDFLPVVFAPQYFPGRSEPVACAVGTGVTEQEAQLSCLGEAIERYSAALDGSERLLRCRANELPARHLSMADLGMNAGQDEIDWTPVWSLTRNEKVWIPVEYCFLGSTTADSNGCAAGRTLGDAIVRGFCEVVERDSLALWWYNRVARPAIPLDLADGSIAAHLHRNFAAIGRTLHLLDLTSDLEIPAVAAVSARADGSFVALGFGAHFQLHTAIRHALLELQQMLGAVDEIAIGESTATPLDRWLRSINLHKECWLRPASAAPQNHSTHSATVESCLEIVNRHGMELLAANLTRPGIDVPVARVIVPGLRSALPRFTPGRLFDVPVALGWLDRALAESELNPIPFFL